MSANATCVCNREEDILILNLPEIYDVNVIGYIMQMADKPGAYKDINYLVIECSQLKIIESCGGEFFHLNNNLFYPETNRIAFVNLIDSLKKIIELLAIYWPGISIHNFSTTKEAIDFLKLKNRK